MHASHIYRVRFKNNILQNEVIPSILLSVESPQIPMAHIIRWKGTPPPLSHAARPLWTARWWTCPVYTLANPNSFVSFRLIKECIACLATKHRIFLSFIWTSRYKKLGFSLRLLALATKPPTNIWSAISIWLCLCATRPPPNIWSLSQIWFSLELQDVLSIAQI